MGQMVREHVQFGLAVQRSVEIPDPRVDHRIFRLDHWLALNHWLCLMVWFWKIALREEWKPAHYAVYEMVTIAMVVQKTENQSS